MTSDDDPLVHLDFDTPVWADDYDTATGLPNGNIAAHAWNAMLESLDARLEEYGWDQPARLFGALTPLETARQLAADTHGMLSRIDQARSEHSAGPGVTLMLGYLGDLDGHPVPALSGHQLTPGHFSALILVTEAWLSHPDFHEPVEARILTLVTVTGDTHRLVHLRDSGSSVDAAVTDDPIPDVLRHVIGALDGTPEIPVSHYLASVALHRARQVLQDIDHYLDPALPRTPAIVERVLSGTQSQLLARFADVMDLEPGTGPLLAALAAGDQRLFDLSDAAVGKVLDAVDQVRVLSWGDLITHGGDVIPDIFTGVDPQWAGPTLLSRLAFTAVDSPDDLLAWIADFAGPEAYLRAVTVIAGWLVAPDA